MSDPKRYWVGFNMVRGIGPARLKILLETFKDVESAWKASGSALRQAGLGQKPVEALLQVREQVDLERVWQQIQDGGINVLTWEDEAYPARLKQIEQPPPVLYIRGNLLPEDDLAIAIVGTRRISAYGRQVTEEIAGALARNRVTVISGLARGVDAIAHNSALNAGGRTLAILGSGVDRIYPGEHRRLAERIMEMGAIISDYPPGTAPDAVNFPPRNRIISGLAVATVITEAGDHSGALITAGFAADQGRDVWAVPGNITALQSVGTNRLVQQGAHPLLEVSELLESLNLDLVSEQRHARKNLPVEETEARLLDVLGREPVHVDEIRNQSGMPIEKVTAILAMMELKGMVRQVGSMQYVALREMDEAYLG